MVTPIETKRGIDPLRFNGRHKVRSTSPYGESGGVGPTSPFSELDGALGPTRPFSAVGPTPPFDELDSVFSVFGELNSMFGELECLFGSVIHFSRVFCSGTFVESVSRNLSYKNETFGRRFRDNCFRPHHSACDSHPRYLPLVLCMIKKANKRFRA